MPKIRYRTTNFRNKSIDLIDKANTVIDEYDAQGLSLTLRQLYYQFVSRGWIPNTPKSYDNLGSVVNDGRLAGMIDWDAIEDRTRNMVKNSHWDSPDEIVAACAKQYQIDKWEGQKYQPEVWIEKEALAGVVEGPCRNLDVPFFACRGYTSQSEMWRASQRLLGYSRLKRTPLIIHLGDHDPSGIDMSRDIEDRLDMFMGRLAPEVRRIALNMDQVQQYNPPPNPAKTTDSRFGTYRSQFGDESWELDALDPPTLIALINDAVLAVRDEDVWNERSEREQSERDTLQRVSDQWDVIVTNLNGDQ